MKSIITIRILVPLCLRHSLQATKEGHQHAMITGTIKKLVEDRGFGFIKSDTPEGDECFFHMSELQRLRFEDLVPGQRVAFDTEDSDRGPRAVRIRPAP